MVCEWHAGLLDIYLDVQARRQGWFIYMHQSREGLGGLCLVFLTVELNWFGFEAKPVSTKRFSESIRTCSGKGSGSSARPREFWSTLSFPL